jgi:predicted  nucleic acid-binding Zn-ribbon protein
MDLSRCWSLAEAETLYLKTLIMSFKCSMAEGDFCLFKSISGLPRLGGDSINPPHRGSEIYEFWQNMQDIVESLATFLQAPTTGNAWYLQSLNNKIVYFGDDITTLQNRNIFIATRIIELNAELSALESDLAELELEDVEELIATLELEIVELTGDIDSLQGEIDLLQEEIDAFDTENIEGLAELNEKKADLEEDLENLNKDLENLNKDLENKNWDLWDLWDLEYEIEKLEEEIEVVELQIETYDSETSYNNDEIDYIKDGSIPGVETEIAEYEASDKVFGVYYAPIQFIAGISDYGKYRAMNNEEVGFEYRSLTRGDYLGDWIVEDLEKCLDAIKYVEGGAVSFIADNFHRKWWDYNWNVSKDYGYLSDGYMRVGFKSEVLDTQALYAPEMKKVTGIIDVYQKRLKGIKAKKDSAEPIRLFDDEGQLQNKDSFDVWSDTFKAEFSNAEELLDGLSFDVFFTELVTDYFSRCCFRSSGSLSSGWGIDDIPSTARSIKYSWDECFLASVSEDIEINALVWRGEYSSTQVPTVEYGVTSFRSTIDNDWLADWENGNFGEPVTDVRKFKLFVKIN